MILYFTTVTTQLCNHDASLQTAVQVALAVATVRTLQFTAERATERAGCRRVVRHGKRFTDTTAVAWCTKRICRA
jgi:hypothetical protein